MVNPIPIWSHQLQYNSRKEPLSNLFNTAKVLRDDVEFADMFWFNEWEQRAFIMRGPETGPVTDQRVLMIQEELQSKGLQRVSREIVNDAIGLVSLDHKYHPIRGWLDGLPPGWDQQPRVSTLLPRYFGTDDNEYYRVVSSCFLTGMVARIYQPGCKADYMPVLEGEQGELKSSACRILAGDAFFSDTLPELTGDPIRLCQHLRGKWLIEIAELSAVAKADPHRLKSFVSTQVERYMPKYGRNEVVEPRQCLFVGTTNDERYLRDDTGGRRFWPVKCGTIDLEGLKRERTQLFAEAVEGYKNGAQWWPDRSFELTYMKPIQESRFQSDAWEDALMEYEPLCPTAGLPLLAIAKQVLNLRADIEFSPTDQRRLISCLHRRGWTIGKRQAFGYPWLPPIPKKSP